MKILIVEDENTLSYVLKEKFKNEGYSVVIAEDGEEACVAAHKFLPDVILLDLRLPKKHGLKVLEELKADEELKSIPVLILSNLDGDDDIKKALAGGAEDYFVKTQHPIAEVVEKVDAVLRKSKKE